MSWIEHTSGQHCRIRYRHADDTIASECGFTNKTIAQNRTQEIDVDRRRDTFYNRTRGRITLNTWLPRWWITLDLDDVTLGNYRYLVERHIGPRFGTHPSATSSPATSNNGPPNCTPPVTSTPPSRASSACSAASSPTPVEDGLLPVNPVHRHHRRGKRAFRIHEEMLWATPEEYCAAPYRPNNSATATAPS